MKRLIQISDSHLSHSKPVFSGNWALLAKWIELQRPDLVVHTGDVTVEGALDDEELRFAASLMASLNVPVLAVPGNHDVGDAGHPMRPITVDRQERWRQHFGADRWFHDVEGWRLIGLNALLIGSEDVEESRQLEWLRETMTAADDRSIAWFLHRPLFVTNPTEGDAGNWAIKSKSRAALLALARSHGVALVASGHLHRSHDVTHGAMRHIWGPSSAFVVGAKEQPSMPGVAQLGAVVYEFDDRKVSVEITRLDDLTPFVIDDVVDQVYPYPKM